MEAMLRKELKDWRRAFRSEHGRDPSKGDMQRHPRMRSVYDAWIALQPDSSQSRPKPKAKPSSSHSKPSSSLLKPSTSLSKPSPSRSQASPQAGTSKRSSPFKPPEPCTPSKPRTPANALTPRGPTILAAESPSKSPSATPTRPRTRETYYRSPRSPRGPREPPEAPQLAQWVFTPRTKARKRLRGEQVPLTPVQKRQRTVPEEELGATPPPKPGRLVPGPRGGTLVPGPRRVDPELIPEPQPSPRDEPVRLEDLPEEEEEEEPQKEVPLRQVEFQEQDVIVQMGTFRSLRRMDELAPQDELDWTLGAFDAPPTWEQEEGIKEDPEDSDESVDEEQVGDDVRRMLRRMDLVSTVSPRRGARSQLRRRAEMRVEQLLVPLSDDEWVPKKETIVAPRKTKATKRARIAQAEAEAEAEAKETEPEPDQPESTLVFSRAGRMGVGDAEDEELDPDEWASEVDDDEKGWGDGEMDFDDVI